MQVALCSVSSTLITVTSRKFSTLSIPISILEKLEAHIEKFRRDTGEPGELKSGLASELSEQTWCNIKAVYDLLQCIVASNT